MMLHLPYEEDPNEECQANDHQHFAVHWKVQEGFDGGVTDTNG